MKLKKLMAFLLATAMVFEGVGTGSFITVNAAEITNESNLTETNEEESAAAETKTEESASTEVNEEESAAAETKTEESASTEVNEEESAAAETKTEESASTEANEEESAAAETTSETATEVLEEESVEVNEAEYTSGVTLNYGGVLLPTMILSMQR